jgi:hypothetical protein
MRSLKHLLTLAAELRERGVGLVVLKQQIDTTTPQGRLITPQHSWQLRGGYGAAVCSVGGSWAVRRASSAHTRWCRRS